MLARLLASSHLFNQNRSQSVECLNREQLHWMLSLLSLLSLLSCRDVRKMPEAGCRNQPATPTIRFHIRHLEHCELRQSLNSNASSIASSIFILTCKTLPGTLKIILLWLIHLRSCLQRLYPFAYRPPGRAGAIHLRGIVPKLMRKTVLNHAQSLHTIQSAGRCPLF